MGSMNIRNRTCLAGALVTLVTLKISLGWGEEIATAFRQTTNRSYFPKEAVVH